MLCLRFSIFILLVIFLILNYSCIFFICILKTWLKAIHQYYIDLILLLGGYFLSNLNIILVLNCKELNLFFHIMLSKVLGFLLIFFFLIFKFLYFFIKVALYVLHYIMQSIHMCILLIYLLFFLL